MPPVTTVSLRVAHFIALHKPFVADFNVPITVIQVRVKRSFIFAQRMEKLIFQKVSSIEIDIRVALLHLNLV